MQYWHAVFAFVAAMALAAVLTPVFLVSSTNVMCDTMMLCFWVWAIVYWRRGLERPGWLLVAGVPVPAAEAES